MTSKTISAPGTWTRRSAERARRLGVVPVVGLLAAVSVSTTAQAYVGPGLGARTIGVVLGFLAAIVMAFVAVLWYPARRLIRNVKSARRSAARGPASPVRGASDTS